ncbi:MetQ/NlpA family ABC transporter substrate-binding protein [Bacteroides sp.]|uniref:ABC transporter substrate-binding protein n=1 Tax=Bacteroides sp. TaxID=29523 RepID=UPI002FCB17BC
MKQVWLLIGCIFILISACTGDKKRESSTHRAEQLQPVNLGVMTTMDGFPFVVAQRLSIYDSLGITVNLMHFDSPSDRDAALQSGQIDGAITDYPSTIMLQAHQTPMGIIMRNNGYLCFVVSPSSGISNCKQLPTKNIAVSRNTVVEYATDLLLQKNSISISEVNMPEIGQIPIRLQMMQYGQIDASFLPDPYATMAMRGGYRSLISTRELGIEMTATAFTQKALNEKEEEIKLLVDGYNRAVTYLQKHPLKEWKQLLMEETGIPEAMTGLLILPAYEPAARASAPEIEKAIAWLKAKGRISPNYQCTNLVDTTFITFK